MINKFIRLLIVVTAISGCENAPETAPELHTLNPPVIKPIVIKSGIENGHPAGIRISIQKTKDTDSSTVFELLSTFENKPVGFLLIIPREIDGKQKRSSSFIKSLGEPSDRFLHLLAKQYNQKIDSAFKMADSIPFICMNLNNFYGRPQPTPRDSAWIAAQYKLFFDAESAEGDAELFMNIVPGRWIEFAEKDEDYRGHLIGLFSRY
jgi:hypothetical protein